MTDEAKLPIRTHLLQCLSNETVPHVRNKVGDAIAEVARQYADAGDAWPELLSALFQCSQSPDSTVREVSFRILATTPGIIERQHENIVQEVFGKGFRDDSVNVSSKALENLHELTNRTGQTHRHRSLCILLQLDHEKDSRKILLSDSRSAQRTATSERCQRSR